MIKFKINLLRSFYLQWKLDRLQSRYNELMLQGRMVEAYDLYPEMFSIEDKLNSL